MEKEVCNCGMIYCIWQSSSLATMNQFWFTCFFFISICSVIDILNECKSYTINLQQRSNITTMIIKCTNIYSKQFGMWCTFFWFDFSFVNEPLPQTLISSFVLTEQYFHYIVVFLVAITFLKLHIFHLSISQTCQYDPSFYLRMIEWIPLSFLELFFRFHLKWVLRVLSYQLGFPAVANRVWHTIHAPPPPLFHRTALIPLISPLLLVHVKV